MTFSLMDRILGQFYAIAQDKKIPLDFNESERAKLLSTERSSATACLAKSYTFTNFKSSDIHRGSRQGFLTYIVCNIHTHLWDAIETVCYFGQRQDVKILVFAIYCDVPGSPCLSKTGAVFGLFFFLNFWVVITRLTDQRIPWPMSCRCLTISSRPNLSDFEDISKNDFAQVFLSISPSIMVRFQKFKNRLTAADPLYQFMAPWLLFGKKDTLISDLSDLSLTPKRHPFLRISVHTC